MTGDGPASDRDAQMDTGAEILREASTQLDEAGVGREPRISLHLFFAAFAALGTDIDQLSPEGEERMREIFSREAAQAFTMAAECLRRERVEHVADA